MSGLFEALGYIGAVMVLYTILRTGWRLLGGSTRLGLPTAQGQVSLKSLRLLAIDWWRGDWVIVVLFLWSSLFLGLKYFGGSAGLAGNYTFEFLNMLCLLNLLAHFLALRLSGSLAEGGGSGGVNGEGSDSRRAP